ncbi:MAG: hypothetical protein HOI41_15240 [Acidimicrobiaceae bacterium]|nr:hypothetical protein [Acidimicrobiaceae bacterium]
MKETNIRHVASSTIHPSASAPVASPSLNDSSAATVDETTEARWFFDGPLPAEVLTWFTNGGTAGVVEDRCDVYRIEEQPRVDVGVKYRNGATLELKLRVRPPQPSTIGRDLDGWMESWQRWSPAGGRVDLGHQTTSVEVDKTIIKRRFAANGGEVLLSADARAKTHQGCDVEIVSISVGDATEWSFAFAAFGPSQHHQSLATAWETLVSDQPKPDQLRLRRCNSKGYPEWLTGVKSGASARELP